MSDSDAAEGRAPAPAPEAMHSALFAQLVMQQANMATLFLGKVPHPETGQPTKDLETARLFIDELEMLEAKTKGNLTKEEAGLLKQSLMSLRLAFVEAVGTPGPQSESKPQDQKPSGQSEPTTGPAPTPAEEDEHRKKFSKKY